MGTTGRGVSLSSTRVFFVFTVFKVVIETTNITAFPQLKDADISIEPNAESLMKFNINAERTDAFSAQARKEAMSASA